jgi:hypothetical protein
LPSYIIHTGWWCDESRKHIGTEYNQSDNRLRTPLFFDVWYDAIRKASDPEKILIVDSASPAKPDLTGKEVELVSMKRNFQHGMICDSKYGGWTRAFLLGAYYAYMNDADYSVFIEQDCMIVGEGIIERAISAMGRKGISYGDKSPVRIEQSFVIMRNDFIPKFLAAYTALPQSDKEVFTEVKFQRMQKWDRFWSYAGLKRDEYTPLPFGYGRMRPLNCSDPHFYAQQWTEQELCELQMRLKLNSLDVLLNSAAK